MHMTEWGLRSLNIVSKYTVITQPADQLPWSYCFDSVLEARSCLQLFRKDLSKQSNQFLDKIDLFWRDHANEFNTFAARHHQAFDPEMALAAWTVDEAGNPVVVPPDHWWWRPIKTASPLVE